MREPGLRVITPVGWRVEKVRRRRIPTTGRTQPSKTAEWLDRLQAMAKVLASGGEIGKFYAWGGGNYPPRELARLALNDKRWIWLPTYGGFLRLADEPVWEHSKPWSQFGPGEFFLSIERNRMPGFCCFEHAGWGKRVNVRMPEGAVSLVDKAAMARAKGGGE